MKITSGHLIKALAIYSTCIISLISFLILASDETDVHQKTIIKMALGLILFWIIIGGIVYWVYRRRKSKKQA